MMEAERHDHAAECPAPEPATALGKAMAFYRQALRTGPRLAHEVLAEGKRQGHAKRTQERARSRLNVQKIPPATWQGPWLIALPEDPVVEAVRQWRKEKRKQQRKGRQAKVEGERGRHEATQ